MRRPRVDSELSSTVDRKGLGRKVLHLPQHWYDVTSNPNPNPNLYRSPGIPRFWSTHTVYLVRDKNEYTYTPVYSVGLGMELRLGLEGLTTTAVVWNET